MKFLNKSNLKNTIRYLRIYIQCTGQSKIDQTGSFFTRAFVLIFLNILIRFLELNNDFKNIIHVDRELTRGIEGGGSPPHIKICFDFKL